MQVRPGSQMAGAMPLISAGSFALRAVTTMGEMPPRMP
jgi:hypothetical protein